VVGVNRAGTGLASVTVQGANFGIARYTQVARVGVTACEATDWFSASSVVCRVSSSTRFFSVVVLTVGESSGTVTEAWTSDSVSLSSLVPLNVASFISASLTVSGRNFGVSGYSGAGRVGDTSCQASSWVSDSSIRCLSPRGVRHTLGFAMSISNDFVTLTELFSFDAPSISTSTTPNHPATGV
jgi:hypothetical protein